MKCLISVSTKLAAAQSSDVGFVFIAGWSDGIDVVRQMARELTLKATVFRHLDESALPFAFDHQMSGIEPEVTNGFKDMCAEIGGFLRSSSDDFDEAKVDHRALGYGNRSMLLASAINVTVQSLTAIWAKGYVDGVGGYPSFQDEKTLRRLPSTHRTNIA